MFLKLGLRNFKGRVLLQCTFDIDAAMDSIELWNMGPQGDENWNFYYGRGRSKVTLFSFTIEVLIPANLPRLICKHSLGVLESPS